MLTYQEAVEAGARALGKRYGEDVVEVDRPNAITVLKAVGYADLLAEVERLREECIIWLGRSAERLRERDALAETVARVEALMRQVERYVLLPDLAAALHPKETDASLQWVLDCDLAPDGTDRR